MKICYEKIKKGDKILLWATVTSVSRCCPRDGYNDVAIRVENDISDYSTMSVELKQCDIKHYIYRETVFEKIANMVKRKLNLSKKELDIVLEMGKQ